MPSGATAVAAGGGHTCAVLDGRALCWGYGGIDVNTGSALGDGSYGSVSSPVQVKGLTSGVKSVACGGLLFLSPANGAFSCALANGSVWCWGNIGTANGANTNAPTSAVVMP
jgi:hypothetical protein